MNDLDILKKIVEEEGDCSWVGTDTSTCSKCPMSRLKTRPDGTYFSCADSLNIFGLEPEEANKLYKDTAARMIVDETVEDFLGGTDGA